MKHDSEAGAAHVVIDEDGVLARWADWQGRSKQVSVADTRVRAAARVLADALADAGKAAAAVVAVNKTYGTDYPTSSKFIDAVAGAGAADALAKAKEVAPTAEYPPIIGTFEDSKDGAALPGLAVLGEYVAPGEVKAEKPAKAKAPKAEAVAEAAAE